MQQWPMRHDFAKAKPRNNEKLLKRRQYQQTADKKNKQQLRLALACKRMVVMVQALCNYVIIHRPKGKPDIIEASFDDACRLLRGQLFYKPIRGRLVNLAHFEKFDETPGEVKILLVNNCEAKLCRDDVKKLRQLKLYLLSNEYANSKIRQLVM
jgi:hypothetical protein